MRWKLYQRTLAISMTGVLFCGGMATAASSTTNAPNLAWQLYRESDWHHAYIKARRQTIMDKHDPIFSQAIAILADLQQAPAKPDRQQQLQLWLETHRDHPKHEVIATEVAALQIRATTRQRPRLTGRIARFVIRFYQNQIGPGIGQRCAMYPSCSHYSLEACRRYGLAGIPMTADRIIRESDHIRLRINPIQHHGRELYHDPVSDHTYWFRRYRP